MQTKYKRPSLQTFFFHFSLLQNPQKYSTSTSSLMIKIQLATLTDSQWSSTLGTQRGCLWLSREPERRGAGGGRFELGLARAAWSRTTQGGVRSLAEVQGGWSAGRLAACAQGWGGSRHSEALPEWTEIFSTAHKGHFSLPQQSHSDSVCVWVRPCRSGRVWDKLKEIFLGSGFPSYKRPPIWKWRG